MSRRGGFVTVVLALGVGCSGGSGGSSVTPSPGPTPLRVTSIAPATGSTGGGTPVKILGTGFLAGATVTLDDERRTVSVDNTTVIQTTTPSHTAGTVDVIVTNPNGQTSRLAGGFTYVAPQSFDFNGTWIGSALAHPEIPLRAIARHSDMSLEFTIQGNRLVGFTCGSPTAETFVPTPTVSDGAFSFVGPGVSITGRIVSDATAVGTIDTDWCPATRWSAAKR